LVSPCASTSRSSGRATPRSASSGHFDTRIFLSGFYTNALLAAALTFLGDRLGIDLYLVALFAFGWRIFQNVAVIRRHFL
jgi:small basic protein